jgi:hypothetical protein
MADHDPFEKIIGAGLVLMGLYVLAIIALIIVGIIVLLRIS